MSDWEPEYRGQPRPDNQTFALIQLAIDRGYNPVGKNKLLSYKFYWFLDAQYIECDVESIGDRVLTMQVPVSEVIFNHRYAKALVGYKKFRKFLQESVIKKYAIDWQYKVLISDKKEKRWQKET